MLCAEVRSLPGEMDGHRTSVQLGIQAVLHRRRLCKYLQLHGCLHRFVSSSHRTFMERRALSFLLFAIYGFLLIAIPFSRALLIRHQLRIPGRCSKPSPSPPKLLLQAQHALLFSILVSLLHFTTSRSLMQRRYQPTPLASSVLDTIYRSFTTKYGGQVDLGKASTYRKIATTSLHDSLPDEHPRPCNYVR